MERKSEALEWVGDDWRGAIELYCTVVIRSCPQRVLIAMTKECVRDLGDDPKEYDVEVNFLERYREVRR